MSKKKKLNKQKFISRIILIVLILAIIIVFIKGLFNKESYETETISLIVDKQNVTENLVSDIYIDTAGNLYLSTEDLKNIFDENLYFEESSGKIITTYGTKVAAINTNDNTMELNSATLLLSSNIINYDSEYYIPLSEITNVYNIEVITTENVGIVLSLYKELITVNTTKKVSLKESPSTFSSTLEKIDEGEEVIFIENSEKSGWIKVLTYQGNIGYIKEKNTTDKETKRANMEESDFSSNNADIENSIEIDSSVLTTEALENFDARKKVVQSIIQKIISDEKYTVNLNLENLEVESFYLERFIIELIPRLKEIGGNVLVTNNNILSDEFINDNNI